VIEVDIDKNTLRYVSIGIFLLGIIYLVGAYTPTHDEHGRQLYKATLQFNAVRPLIGNPYASDLEVSDFRKQGIFSLYNPVMEWFPIEPEYKITTTCDNIQVDYDSVRTTLGFPQDVEPVEVELNNLPAGTTCTVKVKTYFNNNIVDEKRVNFVVPGREWINMQNY